MMKKILALLAVLCLLIGCLAGCDQTSVDPGTEPSGSAPVGGNENPTNDPGSEGPSEPFIDYAGQVTLDFESETVKQEVTVRNFVDGDTTHFNVSSEIAENGILKARYLAVNTPESTGKIEEGFFLHQGKALRRFFHRCRVRQRQLEPRLHRWSSPGLGLVQDRGHRYLPQPEHRAAAERPVPGFQLC